MPGKNTTRTTTILSRQYPLKLKAVFVLSGIFIVANFVRTIYYLAEGMKFPIGPISPAQGIAEGLVLLLLVFVWRWSIDRVPRPNRTLIKFVFALFVIAFVALVLVP